MMSSNAVIFRVKYWPFVPEIHRSLVNSLHKRQWRGAVMFFLSVPQQIDKQSRCSWFETPLRPLWRHRNAPRRSGCNLRLIIFKFILWIHILSISSEITLRWATRGLIGYCSKMVQVMARCRQATGHYRRQWWPRFVSPYGVARPQCHMTSLGLNELKHGSKYKKPS